MRTSSFMGAGTCTTRLCATPEKARVLNAPGLPCLAIFADSHPCLTNEARCSSMVPAAATASKSRIEAASGDGVTTGARRYTPRCGGGKGERDQPWGVAKEYVISRYKGGPGAKGRWARGHCRGRASSISRCSRKAPGGG